MNTTNAFEAKGGTESDLESTRDRPLTVPATDIAETREAILVYMDLPGVEESGIQVDLDNDVLTVSARGPVCRHRDMILTHGEFCDREFRRSFALGAEISRDRIQATLSRGVLKLTLPKAVETGPKRIAVTTAGE